MFIGGFCVVTMVPLALLLRGRAVLDDRLGPARSPSAPGRLPLSPAHVQGLLVLAAIACCVAMSMPQVHIIAHCGDLGYGTARGAEMLSLMLGLGVVSRLGSGFIADRIGGLRTLILGSALQCLSLIFYLPYDGLTSLYIVSALFGLAQGGIVPNYALVVREYFPARETGTRVSLMLMASVVGMAIGGWLSGEIHDLTGSYQAAFLNGIAWNLLNLAIAAWLLMSRRRAQESPAE
jgi:MFS family permease